LDFYGMLTWDDFREFEKAPDGSGYSAYTDCGWERTHWGKSKRNCKKVNVEKCKGTKYGVLVKNTKTKKWEKEERDCPDDCKTCYECTAKYPNIKITAFFDKKKSWVVGGDKTALLLSHENLHFTIAVSGALKATNKALKTTGIGISCKKASASIYARKDLRPKIKKMLKIEWNNMKKIQDKYDEETVHGTKKGKQEEWGQKEW